MQPEGSLPHSQMPATCPYPEPDRSGPRLHPTSWRSILILSSLLRLALASGAWRLEAWNYPNNKCNLSLYLTLDTVCCHRYVFLWNTSHTMIAVVAQPVSCPFAVNTTIELKNVTGSSDSTGIWRGMFRLRIVPALSDVAFLSSIVVLTPRGLLWVLPLLRLSSVTKHKCTLQVILIFARFWCLNWYATCYGDCT